MTRKYCGRKKEGAFSFEHFLLTFGGHSGVHRLSHWGRGEGSLMAIGRCQRTPTNGQRSIFNPLPTTLQLPFHTLKISFPR